MSGIKRVSLAALFAAFMFPVVAAAQSRPQAGFVQGFGGATFGTTQTDSLFGGSAGANLSDNVQLIGEVGYMRDTLPTNLLGDLLGIASSSLDIGVRVPAFYAEGGARLLSGSGPIRGYVEGTAGAARLRPALDLGLENSTIRRIVNGALGYVSTNEPLVGVGGGVIIQPGPFVLDLGYRYKRILGLGGINVSQVRAAAGIAF